MKNYIYWKRGLKQTYGQKDKEAKSADPGPTARRLHKALETTIFRSQAHGSRTAH